MRIVLNGHSIETAAMTLAELVTEKEFDAASVATALNQTFVPRDMRHEADLHEGSHVEVLSPMQGG